MEILRESHKKETTAHCRKVQSSGDITAGLRLPRNSFHAQTQASANRAHCATGIDTADGIAWLERRA